MAYREEFNNHGRSNCEIMFVEFVVNGSIVVFTIEQLTASF